MSVLSQPLAFYWPYPIASHLLSLLTAELRRDFIAAPSLIEADAHAQKKRLSVKSPRDKAGGIRPGQGMAGRAGEGEGQGKKNRPRQKPEGVL